MTSLTAAELFIQLPQYSVIVCRQCQHAVRPTQVVAYLTHSPHRTTIPEGRQVQATIHEWDQIDPDVDRLIFPTSIDRPIPELTVYTDGILCTRSPNCTYVCRSRESLRKHWRTEHQWSPYGRHQGHQASQQISTVQAAHLRCHASRLVPAIFHHPIRFALHPRAPARPVVRPSVSTAAPYRGPRIGEPT